MYNCPIEDIEEAVKYNKLEVVQTGDGGAAYKWGEKLIRFWFQSLPPKEGKFGSMYTVDKNGWAINTWSKDVLISSKQELFKFMNINKNK